MSENMSYAALCKVCGHLCGATVDNPDRPERTARHVAGFIREGLTITRVTHKAIREELQWCTCQDEEEGE